MITIISRKPLRKLVIAKSLEVVGDTIIDFSLRVLLPDGWLSDEPPDIRCFIAMKAAQRGQIIKAYSKHWLITPTSDLMEEDDVEYWGEYQEIYDDDDE